MLGRALMATDGTSDERIAAAEARLGLVLPLAMRRFFAEAGDATVVRQYHALATVEELTTADGFLLFMQENQGVVDWGIPLPELSHAVPVVWQRVNGTEAEWYSEDMGFAEFMARALAWQVGITIDQ